MSSKEETIELLRCAADLALSQGSDPGGVLTIAAAEIGGNFSAAFDAEDDYYIAMQVPYGERFNRNDRGLVLLEVAARLEESC